jgi:hypothetical protein
MTMTDERPAVIPGYAQTPEAQHPPAGGSIAEVAADRAGRPREERLAKEPCDICGKEISHKNLNTHKRNIHGIYKRGKNKGKVVESDKVKLAPPKPSPRVKKPTAEEIVLITVQMRWPNGVPVDKVPGLMAWAKQTERFFNE